MANDTPTAALRGLTVEQVEVFSTRAYTMDNIGAFYERGLIDASGRDSATGRDLRTTLVSCCPFELLRARVLNAS